MSNIPAELKYVASHEWVRVEADGSLLIGITDHAQDLLGDLVFIEPPEAGRELAAGEEAAVVESVKAAADVYAPVAGSVLEGNSAVADSPEALNQDPYGNWLFRLQPANAADLASLLDAAGYAAAIAAEK